MIGSIVGASRHANGMVSPARMPVSAAPPWTTAPTESALTDRLAKSVNHHRHPLVYPWEQTAMETCHAARKYLEAGLELY